MSDWARGWRVVLLLSLVGFFAGMGWGHVELAADSSEVGQEAGMRERVGTGSMTDVVTSDANKVKASFLLNFARYVTWPKTGTVVSSWPVWRVWLRLPTWKIAVLGPDPFGGILERTVAGREAQLHRVEVVHAASVEEAAECHIVFVTLRDEEARRGALRLMRERKLLTVGEGRGFLDEGGMVQLRVVPLRRGGENIVMDINLDETTRVGLEVSAKMVEVAEEVIRDGKRTRRAERGDRGRP